jgi:hypothetical protein
VFTAETAASSHDCPLVPMTSMTRYTLTASSLTPRLGRDAVDGVPGSQVSDLLSSLPASPGIRTICSRGR